ncbi:MAG: ChaN family lipoprotein [Candidatus Stygibacter australis]|nr:ChaN family lipoprotein [Candidatus Stygibacter australis]MDP8320907.1 ChaN family lipoprotein [Candidatus Stygibacter australis]
MKTVFLILGFIVIITGLYADELDAYRLYNTSGEEIGYNEMISALQDADIVLFGEMHDNPISHWLELQVSKSLYEVVGEKLVLGAEMFEADNQLIMDEYLQGLIKTNHFEENVRLWNNYSTDYKPLVEFAVEKNLNFVATNIPRRYANMVARGGFESLDQLSDEAKSYIAPLPLTYFPEADCYKQMMGMTGMPGKMHADNLPKAQASKDATMAYFIFQNQVSDGIFLHFNGRYHSDSHESIILYLNEYAPESKVMTISTSLNGNMAIPEEDKGIADFIIVVPESMTRTY